MSSPFEAGDLPAYMYCPWIDELTAAPECKPQIAKDCLVWMLDDPDRAQSAAEALHYIGTGLHFLPVKVVKVEDKIVDKTEFNFWSETYPPKPGAGGHGHSREGQLWSYIDPRARQLIRIINLLPEDARRLEGVSVEEYLLALNHKVEDPENWIGPRYHPQTLGIRLATEYTVHLPTMGYQRIPSIIIHDVIPQGPGVGLTIQRQGSLEPDTLNNLSGFVHYKGLSVPQAYAALEKRTELGFTLSEVGQVTTSTALVRDLDFRPDDMEPGAMPVPAESGRFYELASEAIHSLERIIRQRAA